MSLLSVKYWASHRALLVALLCTQLIAGIVTMAVVGPSAGSATDDDHTDAVFRSAHAGSCLTWQPEPPQRPAFVQCSSPHLFEVVNSVEGDGDQESCAVSGRRYLGPHNDPNSRFAYGLLRSVNAEGSRAGGHVSLCGLQLPGPNGQQLPIRGLVADQDQSRVWPPGTCLGADMKGGQAGLVPVDCAEPHSVEAVGPIDLGAHFHGGTPPSDAEQESVLRPACITMTTAYLAPKTLSASDLTLNYRPIGPASWSAGSHQVLCALASRTPGPLTGSVKAPGVVSAVPAPVAPAPHPVAPPPAATTTTTTVAPTSSSPTTAAAPEVAPNTEAASAPPSFSSASTATHTAEAPSASVIDPTGPPAAPASPVDNPAHPPQAPPAEPTPAEPLPPSHVLEIPGLAPITLPWAPPPL